MYGAGVSYVVCNTASTVLPQPGLDVVERAFLYAKRAHAGQRRKGSGAATDPPYLCHLIAVASLVWEAGGDDTLVAAALLHDVVEDQGGRPRLDDVRQRFGDRIADLVEHLSDSVVDTAAGEAKAPWAARKRAHLAHLTSAPPDALLVAAADKLHNARAALSDYRTVGDRLWQRFSATDPAAQLWYYQSLVRVIASRLGADQPLARELAETVARLVVEVGIQPRAPEACVA